MPVIELQVNILIDGVPMDGFPLIRRITPAEERNGRYVKANGDGSTYVQQSQLATDNGVVVWTDQPLNVGINTRGPIPLNAGGIIIIIDGNIAAGAATNVTFNNAGANNANVLFLEVGP